MKLFKGLEFKKQARSAKLKVFEKMKTETDHAKWQQLKEEFDAYDRMEKPGGSISNDQLAKIGGSLLMLGLVLKYEKMDIICTKAWSWIRPRE